VPIWKFRSLEEAERTLRRQASDADLPAHLHSLYALVHLLTPPPILPRGVRRFRSIEEANADRTARERAAAARRTPQTKR
jgi:hypothetical protein